MVQSPDAAITAAQTPLEWALRYNRYGLSVVPIPSFDPETMAEDEAKHPRKGFVWKQYQQQRMPEHKIREHWHKHPTDGIAIVCGAVSQHLEVLDFDDEPLFEPWLAVMTDNLGEDFAQSLLIIKTPKGYHLWYRCPAGIAGSKKLALRPNPDQEDKNKTLTLIETRGEGALAVAPGSPLEVHPLRKPYEVYQKNPIPEVTAEQRQHMLDVAMSFNEALEPAKVIRAPNENKGSRPGDRIARLMSWNDVLEPHGWVFRYEHQGKLYYKRPGNPENPRSAIVLPNDNGGYFWAYTSGAPPVEKDHPYSMFALYTLLTQGRLENQAFTAASRELFRIENERQGRKWVKRDPHGEADEPGPEPPEPITFDDEPAPPVAMPPFPSVLKEYVQAVAETTQTPPGMAIMMALSCLATACQRRFEVRAWGSYRETLSLWTVSALPPGSLKSAVVGALTFPFVDWEKRKRLAMRHEIAEHEVRQSVERKRLEKLEKDAVNTADKARRDQLLAEITDIKESLTDPPQPPQLFTTDATAERLQGLLAENGERMALLNDEGGIFEVMSGLYSDGKVNLDIFLKSYTGTIVRVERGGRKVALDKPALTFGLALQPKVLEDLQRGSKKRNRDTGLLGRFLYYFPQSNIGNRDFTQEAEIPDTLKRAYARLIEDILVIPPALDEYGEEGSHTLELTAEARTVLHDFMQSVEIRQGDNRPLAPIQDWTTKLYGVALRVAALCHLATYGLSMQALEAHTLREAVAFCESLIPHAQKAFAAMREEESAVADARKAWPFVLREAQTTADGARFIPKRQVFRAFFKGAATGWTDKVRNVLIERGLVVAEAKFRTGGCPQTVWWLNPTLFATDPEVNGNGGA